MKVFYPVSKLLDKRQGFTREFENNKLFYLKGPQQLRMQLKILVRAGVSKKWADLTTPWRILSVH